ncbi:MFS transporter [Propioniciclava flava]
MRDASDEGQAPGTGAEAPRPPLPSAYRWWLASDSSAAAAVGLREFTLPLLALLVTGSAAQAGLVGTVQAVLTQVCLIPGGLLIDRFDRRRLIMLHGVVQAVTLLALAALAWSGQLTLGFLVVGAALVGMAGGCLGEASDALLRSIVPVERYPQAITLNEGRDAALRSASAPVGGLLMGIVSGASLALAGVLNALSVALIQPLRTRRTAATDARGAWSLFVEAARWLRPRRRAHLLAVLVGAVNFSVSGVMTTTQFTVFARTGQALDAGLITTAAGVSVVVGALVAGLVVSRVRTGVLIPVTFAWLALGMTGVALFPSGPPLVVLLMLTFLGVPAVNAGLAGFFFGATPEAMQGRVQAIVGTVTVGFGALAPVIVGVALQAFGTSAAYAIALGPVAVALIVSCLARPITEIPRPDLWADLEL